MTVVARQTGGPATFAVPENPRVRFVRCLENCGHAASEISDEQLRETITCPGCNGRTRIFYAQRAYVVARYGLA